MRPPAPAKALAPARATPTESKPSAEKGSRRPVHPRSRPKGEPEPDGRPPWPLGNLPWPAAGRPPDPRPPPGRPEPRGRAGRSRKPPPPLWNPRRQRALGRRSQPNCLTSSRATRDRASRVSSLAPSFAVRSGQLQGDPSSRPRIFPGQLLRIRQGPGVPSQAPPDSGSSGPAFQVILPTQVPLGRKSPAVCGLCIFPALVLLQGPPQEVPRLRAHSSHPCPGLPGGSSPPANCSNRPPPRPTEGPAPRILRGHPGKVLKSPDGCQFRPRAISARIGSMPPAVRLRPSPRPGHPGDLSLVEVPGRPGRRHPAEKRKKLKDMFHEERIEHYCRKKRRGHPATGWPLRTTSLWRD